VRIVRTRVVVAPPEVIVVLVVVFAEYRFVVPDAEERHSERQRVVRVWR
jgi:hypothetical protein